MSIELRVLCEGQTEQGFVTQVLSPHLSPFRVFPRAEPLAAGRFGGVSFDFLRKAIKQDVGRSRNHQYVTTMVDLYGIGRFPGAAKVAGESAVQRALRIEARMAEALPNNRFIPYIQVHEFEALVFVDLDQLPTQFPDGDADDAPEALKQEVGNTPPEEINDGQMTAPSKRLIQEVPAYKHLKSIAGPAIAARIGLTMLRNRCHHFNEWVTRLEQLADI